MEPKLRYRVKNWAAYNEALRRRGDLEVWIDEDALDGWRPVPSPTGRGRPRLFSDEAIIWVLTLRLVFKLPLRAAEGLAASLLRITGRSLPVPDFSTLCRRQRGLPAHLVPRPCDGRIRAVLVDSTGVKVFGEGEWKVRKHGAGKRRRWMKLHLAVNADDQEIVAWALTDNDVGDSEVLGDLLGQIRRQIDSVVGDGAYDGWECRAEIHACGARAVVPPPAHACINDRDTPEAHERNAAIVEIGLSDRADWKKRVGYHVRSRVETAMFRFKVIIGERFRARIEPHQQAEAALATLILNKLAQLGMPVIEKVIST